MYILKQIQTPGSLKSEERERKAQREKHRLCDAKTRLIKREPPLSTLCFSLLGDAAAAACKNQNAQRFIFMPVRGGGARWMAA